MLVMEEDLNLLCLFVVETTSWLAQICILIQPTNCFFKLQNNKTQQDGFALMINIAQNISIKVVQ